MNTILARLSSLFAVSRTGSPSTVRLRLESLEERALPTVNYYGGGVLPHVEAQPVFFGNQFSSNSTYYNDAVQVNNFTGFIVNSGYMDMLTNAGYGVGRGTASNGVIANYALNPNYYLTDSQIQSDLQGLVNAHSVATPDANRLYLVFVEPNIAVQMSNGQNSQRNFLGYHGGFNGSDGYGHSATIHYTVVTFPGGSVGNATIRGLSAVQQMTEVASHELAESVTDPNVAQGRIGWYDYSKNGEIGDIVNGQYIVYHGYVVQKEANRQDQAIVPPDYTGASVNLMNAVVQSMAKTASRTDTGDAVFSSGLLTDSPVN